MSELDWTIIAVYLLGLIGMSVLLGRGQKTEEDYYVGGRDLPWWAVGISTMATQTSVISFISIPAFVALKDGGGLTWLQYELAVPLAMIFIMVLLIPFFRKLELISVYEYLEMRFSRGVRKFVSAVFLLSRGLGTGAGVYASALVIQVATGLELYIVIALVGIITIIYDTIGGMKAVVWSDVVQMGVLLVGLVLCIIYALDLAGGWDAATSSLSPERWTALNSSLGFDGEPGFWPFLLGGFFLYASYYGTDQSQTQRELSAPTLADTKRSLVFNGLARFPLTLLYLALGVALAAALVNMPDLARMLDESGKPDNLVPLFIVHKLPGGMRALLIAAMLAAAMSSLDSALNSLSAATMRDFVHGDRDIPSRTVLIWSKVTTIAWGILITVFAFFVKDIGGTVIEQINSIGSAFYGPILAAFVLGVLSTRVNATGILVGVVAGVGINLFLWSQTDVHFMWWNLTGFAVAVALAFLGSAAGPRPRSDTIARYTLTGAGMWAHEREWLRTYGALVVYFGLIVGVGFLLNGLAP